MIVPDPFYPVLVPPIFAYPDFCLRLTCKHLALRNKSTLFAVKRRFFFRGRGADAESGKPTPVSRILKYSDKINLLVVEGNILTKKSEFPNLGEIRLSRLLTQLRGYALNTSYTVRSELMVGVRSKRKITQPPI